LIAKYNLLGVSTANAALQADTFQKNLQGFIGGGIDAGLTGVADALTKMAQQTVTVSEGFRQMGVAFGNFVAQFLMDIAKAIAKQLILIALQNMGGPVGAAAGAVLKAGTRHEGGVVGSGPRQRVRQVDSRYFANAPRYHEGLPGLKSDEVPAILQQGEQVLARDDPNNVLNGANRTTTVESKNRFVLVDDQRNVAAAMQSAEGEQATLVNLKKNAATVRQIARG